MIGQAEQLAAFKQEKIVQGEKSLPQEKKDKICNTLAS
jgi:hypothetical protein